MKLCLEPEDPQRIAILCGQHNNNLHIIEKLLDLKINHRGNLMHLSGESSKLDIARNLLHDLYGRTDKHQELPLDTIHMSLQNHAVEQKNGKSPQTIIKLRNASVSTYGTNQYHYVESIQEHDISFGIGPAGTGKTYLAVACALHALESSKAQRIILTRPAVEAGENLGFLPGDLSQKIDPYLLPLQDALSALLGQERYERMSERGVVELAPLAYMRGRTLTDAFIILDEAQNTTPAQMKMFLTRLGIGSTAVVSGDLTQADLSNSGLADAVKRLGDVRGIGFNYFDESDVRRHDLVRRIIQAWDTHKPPGLPGKHQK
jgi:phosphate starvation-inducible PhoH-like protein